MSKKITSLFLKDADNATESEIRTAYGKFSSVLGMFFNVVLFGMKLLAGLISGSVAIVADAINNLSDASSNVISFFGFKLASKPADAEHPYGHGRYEYLSAAIVAMLIMVIGSELLKSGIDKIITPTAVDFTLLSVIILLVSIIVKIGMSILNAKIGKKINSDVLKATAVDSRNDALSTTAVLVAAVISHFTSLELDGYMTVIVAVFVLLSGIGIFKDTINPLLGKAADKERVEYIKRKLLSYNGVLGIHDLILHDYGVGRQFASVHLEMSANDNVLQSHEIIDGIEKDFAINDNISLVIHYDPVCIDNEYVKELREFLVENVKKINDKLTVHDVRVVEGIERDIVIFDCVLPYDVTLSEKELKQSLSKMITKAYPRLTVNITVDRSFVEV